MWRTLYSQLDWRRRAPRWSAVLLGTLVVADGAHLVVDCHAIGSAPDLPRVVASSTPLAAADPQRIVGAHLFGVDKAESGARDGASAPETRLALALSGIIATRDPNEGFAILGAQGQPGHVYHSGSRLTDVAGSLYQIFADRVVLDLDGHLETLRLPRHPVEGLTRLAAARQSDSEGAEPAADADSNPELNPAQSWFASLYPQAAIPGTRVHGLTLRPDGQMQRDYHLEVGDVLNEVNGVEITDPDSLNQVLKAAGRSFSVTFTRDGVQQTLTVNARN